MTTYSQIEFLNAVSAACELNAPICDGNSRKRLSVASVAKIASQLKPDETADEQAFDSIAPPNLSAAWRVYQSISSSPMTLDGLVVRQQACDTIHRITRWPTINLWLILIFSVAGMLMFYNHLLPVIDSFSQKHPLDAVHPDHSHSGPVFHVSKILLWVNFGVVGTLGCALMFGGVRRFVAMVGGREYVAARISAVAITVVTNLVRKGLPFERAIDLTVSLIGADGKERLQITQVCKRIDNHRALQLELGLLNQQTIFCLKRLKATITTVLIAISGGIVALMYSVIFFAPFYQLLSNSHLWGQGP